MNNFYYKDGELWCEDIAVRRIAQEAGTPVYVYSSATLTRHFQVFDQAFSDVPHVICFSLKSNSNISILRLLVKHGAGVDIVSGGELFRALEAGAIGQDSIFWGRKESGRN